MSVPFLGMPSWISNTNLHIFCFRSIWSLFQCQIYGVISLRLILYFGLIGKIVFMLSGRDTYPNSWWQRNLSSPDSIAKPPCPYHPFLLWRRDLRSLQSHDFLTIHGSANSSPLSMAAWLPQALQCEYLSEAELACRQGGRPTIFRWRKNILFCY